MSKRYQKKHKHARTSPVKSTESMRGEPTRSEKRTIFSWIYHIIVHMFSSIFWRSNARHTEDNSNLLDRVLKLEKTVIKLSKQLLELKTKKITSTQPSPAATGIPPPPPIPCIPPPPPPPLPASHSVVPTKRKVSCLVGISANDLMNVKLRKKQDSSENFNKQSAAENKTKKQLVTLHDLRNVKLKARKTVAEESKNFQSPKQDAMSLKKLRKTNIIRSPGGTPMVKRDLENSTADGLTPAFTKALRKKFQTVQVSPTNNSPRQWRC